MTDRILRKIQKSNSLIAKRLVLLVNCIIGEDCDIQEIVLQVYLRLPFVPIYNCKLLLNYNLSLHYCTKKLRHTLIVRVAQLQSVFLYRQLLITQLLAHTSMSLLVALLLRLDQNTGLDLDKCKRSSQPMFRGFFQTL